MNRRGIVLLTVLWLVVALTVTCAGVLALARTAFQASGNRILLARSEWAREACLAIVQGRYAVQDSSLPPLVRLHRLIPKLDSVDLGRSTWCSVTSEDPGSQLNINLADGPTLSAVLGSDSLVSALLDWRDADDVPRTLGAESGWYRTHRILLPRNGSLASVDELGRVRGFDSITIARLRPLLTVRGDGRLNLNSAPPELLRRALQLPGETIDLLMRRRRSDLPVGDLDELLSRSSPPVRDQLQQRYAELIDKAAFGPTQVLIIATGHVGRSPLIGSVTVTVVALPARLAVLRRETA